MANKPAALVFILAAASVQAQSLDNSRESKGALLYSTHCIGCHTEKVHWRDNHLAANWDGLVKQVKRWQEIQKLNWDEESIQAVSRYLNNLYYHYPAGQETVMSKRSQNNIER